ncbi:hypothetical protein Goari_011509, partial [Gossypium aridum]|nr:hypothetical protein [Gossypium aridum]
MAISYWALWYNPSKAYHEGVRKRVHEVLAFISAYISEMEKLEDIAELGFKKVFVEGDALIVIKRVKVVEEDKSNISNLVKEIKERFCIFDKIEFRYVSLKANEVAHALATEGRRYEIPKYWIEEALKKVEDLANQDRS